MTHTPGPWKVDKVTRYIGAPEIVSDRRRIAKVLYHGGSEDHEVDDNAAYIVQACNAYPALLEALRPFAFLGEAINRMPWKDDHTVWAFDGVELTVGDFRKALLVVAQVEENMEGAQ